MDTAIDVIGWIAAGVLLGAYAQLSRGRLSGQQTTFQTLNIVGSLLVGANSFAHEAWPSVSVNGVWLLIGVGTLVAARRRDRGAVDLEGAVPADEVVPGDGAEPTRAPAPGDERAAAGGAGPTGPR